MNARGDQTERERYTANLRRMPDFDLYRACLAAARLALAAPDHWKFVACWMECGDRGKSDLVARAAEAAREERRETERGNAERLRALRGES